METYLTIAELAGYIKLSEQTVRRYVLNREIPYHKIKKVIRFRVSEIERWVDGGGLDGAVTPGPEDGRERDLFAGLEAEEGGELEAEAGAGGEAGEAETETAVEEGDNTGGAA